MALVHRAGMTAALSFLISATSAWAQGPNLPPPPWQQLNPSGPAQPVDYGAPPLQGDPSRFGAYPLDGQRMPVPGLPVPVMQSAYESPADDGSGQPPVIVDQGAPVRPEGAVLTPIPAEQPVPATQTASPLEMAFGEPDGNVVGVPDGDGEEASDEAPWPARYGYTYPVTNERFSPPPGYDLRGQPSIHRPVRNAMRVAEREAVSRPRTLYSAAVHRNNSTPGGSIFDRAPSMAATTSGMTNPEPFGEGNYRAERDPRLNSFASQARYQVENGAPGQDLPSPSDDFAYDAQQNGGSCNSGSCDDGCGHGGGCGWMFVFGNEITFLGPDRDGVFSSVNISSPADTFSATSDNNMEFGPRLWFGMQKGCWEVLGRFWYLGGVENNVDPLQVGTGDTRGLLIDSDVEAYTVDVEAIRHFCCAEYWDLHVGVGYRYASLEDVAYVTGTGANEAPLPAVVHATAFAHNETAGSGFLVSFGGSRPVHCFCCSTLDFFWNMRGSLTWGGVNSIAQTTVTVIDPNTPGAATRFDAAAASTDDEMFIGELQVGMRWTHALRCAPAIAFCHMAFEYQWWDADGSLAMVESIASVNDNFGRAVASSGPNVELSLVGFTLGAGLMW